MPSSSTAAGQNTGQDLTIIQRPINSQPHILIVDNLSCDGWTWAGALRRAGYRVALASDTDAGWHALDSDAYTMLITCQDATGRTGVELIRKVRAIPEDLPCILIRETNAPKPEDMDRLVDPGATLEKPVTIPALLATVRALLLAVATIGGNVAVAS